MQARSQYSDNRGSCICKISNFNVLKTFRIYLRPFKRKYFLSFSKEERFGDHQPWWVYVLLVLSAEKFIFFRLLSNLIKLWYVYGEHLRFADYVGLQILGFLRRNDRIKNQYVEGKEHVLFGLFTHIFLNLVLTSGVKKFIL